MSLVEFATRRRVTVAMVTFTFVLFGLIALRDLKVNLLPDLSYPTLTVRTEYTGAAPAEIETLISEPVEEAVGVVKNLRKLTSVSRTGQSDVVLEFAWGTDMDQASLEVRDKLEVLQLPLEAKAPVLLRFNPSTEPIMRLVLTTPEKLSGSEQAELMRLRRYADDELKKRLEPVDGVAAVKVAGGLEDEVQVQIDAGRLAQLNLPLGTVIQRLAQENVNISGGRIEEGSERYLVRTVNQFADLDQMRELLVTTLDGVPVRLKDVATVTQGYKEREAIIRLKGREAVELAIYKEGDANTVAVAAAVRKALANLQNATRAGGPGAAPTAAGKPGDYVIDGIAVSTIEDQSKFIQNALTEVKHEALLGGLFAILIIFFFLRDGWSTFVIGLSLPISIVATFFFMGQLGLSLNVMSLAGLALATGMVVDDSIVVLESIAKARERGLGVLQAAIAGTREVSMAVVASTLTTVAVFFPLVFVQGVAGQLFKDQALTVSIALMISLVVSLTLIPMLSSLKDKAPLAFAPEPPHPEWQPQGKTGRVVAAGTRGARQAVAGGAFGVAWAAIAAGRGLALTIGGTLARVGEFVLRPYDWAAARYRALLPAALDRPWPILGGAALAFVVALLTATTLGTDLIPQLAQDRFEMTAKLPPGTQLRETDALVRAVQQAHDGDADIAALYGVSGTGTRLDANPTESGENVAKLDVVLGSHYTRETEAAVTERMRKTMARFPDVAVKFGRPELFSFSTPLEIELRGQDLASIERAGRQLAQLMQGSPHFADVKSSVEQGYPEIQIRFDQARAAALGMTTRQIADQVVRQVRGEVATRYSFRDRKIDVLVRGRESDRGSVEDIRRIIVNPASDKPVTLAAVADVVETMGPSEIHRADQTRVAVVSSNLRGVDLGTAVQEVRQLVRDHPLGADIRLGFGGQSEELDSSIRSLLFAFGLAIFLVYLVMASQFESLLHPFVIMFSVPLAMVGAVLALWLSGSPVSVVVFIGLILLVGIVVKNAIVLIDKVNQLREEGVAKREALCRGAESRLRPIIMTTLTTLFGFGPAGLLRRRRRRGARADGHHRDRRPDRVHPADAGGDPDHVRPARPQAGRLLPRTWPAQRDHPRHGGGGFVTLAELSLRRPVTAVMFFVSMVVIGLIASLRLPLEQFPDVNVPFLMVSFPYPGSTPQEVERSITRPAEEALATLPGIKELNSTSRADGADVFIQFKDWDRDINITATEARDRIDAIRSDLPDDLQRYFVNNFSPSDQPMIRVRFSSNRDLRDAYELLQDQVQRRIERVPGVAKVEISGASPSEVEISIDPSRLGAHNLSLNDLAAKLRAVNFSVSAGEIDEGKRRLRVQPVGEIRDLDQLRNLALNAQGLRLSDIADVHLQPQRQGFGRRLDGRPAVGLDIYREQSANLVNTARAVMTELDDIKQSPELNGIQTLIFDNQADSVTDSIKELVEAGAIGSSLSLLVLFYFLRHWPSTLMVTLAIPICIVMTLGAMYFFGISLNVLSMMGLLLGIGMLVDNAVVVVESIYQYREKYPDDPVRCAIEGTRGVQLAISAGTLTSIIVFLPNIFGKTNMISIYLAQVAITITIALLCSWLVAVSLIPMISARLATPPAVTAAHGFVPALTRRYAGLLRWSLEHRGKALLGILLIVAVSLVPAKFTQFDMFPNEAGKEMGLFFNWRGSYSLEQMSDEIAKVEKHLEANRKRYHIKQIYVYFAEQGWGGMRITLDDGGGYKPEAIQELMRKEMPKLARAEIGFQGGGNGMNKGDEISAYLHGDSSDVLTQIGDGLVPLLAKRKELRDVRVDSGDENSEIQVTVNRERAASYGFSAQEVAQYIGIALRGAPLREFRRGNAEVPVTVRFAGADKFRVEDLSSLNLHRADGSTVPLLSLVDVAIRRGASQISRQDRRTSQALVANVADGYTKDQARKAVEEVLGGAELPPGYGWSWGQTFSDDDEAGSQMGINTLIALFMILVVMAALFESLLFPLAILSSILFSALGVFWVFALTGTTFSIMASIGILVLMGVVVNNGIVMVEHINALRRSGLSRTDALVEGSKERLRPILMTMGTTILGMLPLCLAGAQVGGDGPPYYPMARAVAGGLAFSTVVSLLFLPTIYAMLDDLGENTRRLIGRARAAAPFGRAAPLSE